MSAGRAVSKKRIVWWNNKLLPEDEVCISPFDRGLLYGDGLFETLRAENGQPLYVTDHWKRLREAAIQLRFFDKGDENATWVCLESPWVWRERISAVLKRNGLHQGIARVKILLTRGPISGVGLPRSTTPTIGILAEPYTPPSSEEYDRGWTLCTLSKGWTPPTAAMKTLNYLFYLWARQQALDAGYDESLIYDKDGRMAETATGNLLFLTEGHCAVSASPYRLKGTTEGRLVELLREDGWIVEEKDLQEKDLSNFHAVWMTNALLGIMPIRAIDGRPLPRLLGFEASRYRDLFFRRGLQDP
ncbi:MAG: aminotransferase class IV [Desulfosoma sp.]